MKNLKLYASLLPLLLFTGCSWSEYFVINNLSDQPIFISYTITKPKEHNFGIFEHSPNFYKTTKQGKIDWNNKVEIKDTEESSEIVNIILPPKTTMIFGRLQNDTYTHYNQNFINDREFNLDFIEIEINLEILHISKNTFNKNFSKDNGIIKFDVE
ncbi:MAG: hypothetical protein P1U41_02665 [Vicingaceae bacterium]|nr:hypothetical protein [Vicingaceae bacterium]